MLHSLFYGAFMYKFMNIFGVLGMLVSLSQPSTSAAQALTEDEKEVLKLGPETPPKEFGGIGVSFGNQRDGGVEIWEVTKDLPAHSAGIKFGDVLLEVDGCGIKSNSQEEARKLIAGEPGTEVTLTLLRRDDPAPFKLKLLRAVIFEDYLWNRPGYASAVREMIQPLADSGIPEAQNQIGVFYQSGLRIERDFKKARDWYTKAASQGNTAAQYNLGMLHYDGKGMAKDVAEGIKLIRISADGGYAPAQIWLGRASASGTDMQQDKQAAYDWYIKALEQDSRDAQYPFGILLNDSDFSGKHDVDACFWLRNFSGGRKDQWRGLQGNSGSKKIDVRELLRTIEGRMSVEQKKSCKTRIRNWMPKYVLEAKTKAKNGDTKAQRIMVAFYRDRIHLQPAGPEFAQEDYNDAVYWQKILAEKGDVGDQLDLADMYIRGVEIQIDDPEEAKIWYSKAADQLDNPELSDGTFGRILYTRDSIFGKNEYPPNFLNRLKENGREAERLADIYEKGKGTEKNLVEAYKWRVIVEAKYPRPGNSCVVGGGDEYNSLIAKMTPEQIAQGQQLAGEWLKNAAKEGNRDQLRPLARAHARGLIGIQNFEEAFFWFWLAMQENKAFRSSGDKDELKEIAQRLSPEKIEDIKKRVKEYKLPPLKKPPEKIYGTDPNSTNERVQCIRETRTPCIFDLCQIPEANTVEGCKSGWKRTQED